MRLKPLLANSPNLPLPFAHRVCIVGTPLEMCGHHSITRHAADRLAHSISSCAFASLPTSAWETGRSALG